MSNVFVVFTNLFKINVYFLAQTALKPESDRMSILFRTFYRCTPSQPVYRKRRTRFWESSASSSALRIRTCSCWTFSMAVVYFCLKMSSAERWLWDEFLLICTSSWISSSCWFRSLISVSRFFRNSSHSVTWSSNRNPSSVIYRKSPALWSILLF